MSRTWVQRLLTAACMFISSIGPAIADSKSDSTSSIAFSIKKWTGDYITSDTDASKNTPCTGGIWTVDLESGEVKQLVDAGGMTAYPVFSRDRRWLYFQSNGTGQYEIYRCKPDGTEVQNLTGPRNLNREFDSYGFSIAVDGTKVLHTIHNGKVAQTAIMNADGSDRHPINVPGVDYFYMGALNPDRQRMAFANVSTNYSLMIADLSDGQSRLLEKGSPNAGCIGPQFTADGKTLIFLKTNGELYSVSANGGELRQLTNSNQYNTFYLSTKDEHGSTDPPDLSPDQQRIAFIGREKEIPQVFTMNLDGSDRRQVTYRSSACGRVKWSPDGTKLAFVSFEGIYPQLFVVDSNGGEPKKLTDLAAAVYFINWRPLPQPNGK